MAKEEKIKMTRLKEEAHRKLKMYSAKRNMTMQDYIEYLIELDEEIMEKENEE